MNVFPNFQIGYCKLRYLRKVQRIYRWDFRVKSEQYPLQFVLRLKLFISSKVSVRLRQTWRATELHVSFRLRTHEKTHRPAAFWLGRKTQKFSCTNQKPERTPPFGTGLVRHCPQGVFSPSFTFLRAIFSRPFRLSLGPTICPWISEDG